MGVSVKTPTIYPIIVPTNSGLRTFNFYLVENEGTLFLVDAGEQTEECWQALLDTLEQNKFTITDIDAIVLTHHHADHIGLVNRIRSKDFVPVYAHPKAIIRLKRERTFLEQRIQFFNKLYAEMGCGDDASSTIERMKQSIEKNDYQKINGVIDTVVEGDTLFGFQIIGVPGHALDQIALFHEKSGTMFVGDHIIKHSASNALIELGEDGERTPSLILYEQSLQKILRLDVEVAYSGHGDVIESPHSLIQKKLKRMEEKSHKIVRLLNSPKTAAEIAKLIYKHRYETLFSLIMSEIIGHLDRLEHLGEIRKEKSDNIYYNERN